MHLHRTPWAGAALILLGLLTSPKATADDNLTAHEGVQIASTTGAYVAAGLMTAGAIAHIDNRNAGVYTLSYVGMAGGLLLALPTMPIALAKTRIGATRAGAEYDPRWRRAAIFAPLGAIGALVLLGPVMDTEVGLDGDSVLFPVIIATSFVPPVAATVQLDHNLKAARGSSLAVTPMVGPTKGVAVSARF